MGKFIRIGLKVGKMKKELNQERLKEKLAVFPDYWEANLARRIDNAETLISCEKGKDYLFRNYFEIA